MRNLTLVTLVAATLLAVVWALVWRSPEPAAAGLGGASAEAVRVPAPSKERGAAVPSEPAASVEARSPVSSPPAAVTPTWDNGLRVRVLADGKPVSGAEVQVLSASTRQVQSTGADGRCAFASLPPATDYAVQVAHADFLPCRTEPVAVNAAGEREEVLELERGLALRGRVFDASTGEPIGGAELALVDPLVAPDPSAETAGRRVTVSGDDGRYAFANVPPGIQELQAVAEGHARLSIRYLAFDADQPEGVEQDLELEREMAIAGRVVRQDGVGVEGARIQAFSAQPGRSGKGLATSAANGSFALSGLLPGDYQVQVRAGGDWIDPLENVPAGTLDLEIEVQLGAVVGRVARAGGDPGFEVVIHSPHPLHPAFGAKVAEARFESAEGSFRIDGLAEGTYVAEARAPGLAPGFSERFDVLLGEPAPSLEIALGTGGRITGRVFDAQTAQPLEGALLETRESGWVDDERVTLHLARGLSRSRVPADASGRCEAGLLMRGRYQARVSLSGYAPYVIDELEVTEGETIELGRIELLRAARIAGTVYAQDGKPARGVEVFLRATDESIANRRQTRTDGEGRYSLVDCAPGSYRISTVTLPGDQEEADGIQVPTLVLLAGRRYVQDLYVSR